MSLYAFENSGSFDAIFAIFFIIMSTMLILACITLYRSHTEDIKKNVKRLDKVRYLTLFCVIIQYITFIGYYIHSPLIHEALWNVWIPAFTIALALLSLAISNIYLDTILIGQKIAKKRKRKKNKNKSQVVWSKNEEENKKIQARLEVATPTTENESTSYDFDDDISNISTSSTTNNNDESKSKNTTDSNDGQKRSLSKFTASTRLLFKEKIKPIFWKVIWTLWCLCSLSNWMGSILGWGFGILLAQAFFYMFWKLIAFIMLILCNYILYIVYQRLENVLANSEMNANKKMNKQLAEGRQRIKKLMICESILICVFFVSVVYEIYVMLAIAAGDVVNNIYAESTLMSMVAYFPVWTIIHIVLLVYCWISKSSYKVKKEIKIKKKRNDDIQNGTQTSIQLSTDIDINQNIKQTSASKSDDDNDQNHTDLNVDNN